MRLAIFCCVTTMALATMPPPPPPPPYEACLARDYFPCTVPVRVTTLRDIRLKLNENLHEDIVLSEEDKTAMLKALAADPNDKSEQMIEVGALSAWELFRENTQYGINLRLGLIMPEESSPWDILLYPKERVQFLFPKGPLISISDMKARLLLVGRVHPFTGHVESKDRLKYHVVKELGNAECLRTKRSHFFP